MRLPGFAEYVHLAAGLMSLYVVACERLGTEQADEIFGALLTGRAKLLTVAMSVFDLPDDGGSAARMRALAERVKVHESKLRR